MAQVLAVTQEVRGVFGGGLTVAVAEVADAYGAAQEAGGPAEVAGARVGDVVVAADLLLGHRGDRARGGAAHDAVSAVGLVGHAGVRPGTHHVGAGLCGRGQRCGFKFPVGQTASPGHT